MFSKGIPGSVWQKQYAKVTCNKRVLGELQRAQMIPHVYITDWFLVCLHCSAHCYLVMEEEGRLQLVSCVWVCVCHRFSGIDRNTH